MINSEKELEDYICEHQNEFIDELEFIYHKSNIEFLGRQIRIGNDNIADLIYYYEDEGIKRINYIIVELKFRELQPKDLSQLTRYINLLSRKLEKLNYKNFNVYGLFVSFGCSYEMQNIQMTLKNDIIKYLQIKNELFYEEESYIVKDEYIQSIELDKKITNIIKEVKDE